MKFNICTIVLIGVLGITPLCYAQTPSDNTSMENVKQETQDLLQTLDAYTVVQKDEAIRKTKKTLDSLDKRIAALEARVDEGWDKMDKVARKKARESLKVIRKQRNQVAEWYDSLKSSTGDAWEHSKKGFSDAYQALSNAWEKSEKGFGSDK